MTTTTLIYSMRAENLAGNYEPMHSDYPVALLTRRTYALSAAQILECRAIAPVGWGHGRQPRHTHRPPG